MYPETFLITETLSVGGGELAVVSVRSSDHVRQEAELKTVPCLPPIPSPRTKKKTKDNKDNKERQEQNIERILQELRSQVTEKDLEISILKQERSKMKEIVRTEISEIRDIKTALSKLSFNSSPSNEEISKLNFCQHSNFI